MITREGRFVFDYDRVDAVLYDLLEVPIDRYTVSKSSMEKIQDLLDLKSIETEEGLRAVRNAVVRRLRNMEDEIDEDNIKDLMHIHTMISGITAVIDHELWTRGYEV